MLLSKYTYNRDLKKKNKPFISQLYISNLSSLNFTKNTPVVQQLCH